MPDPTHYLVCTECGTQAVPRFVGARCLDCGECQQDDEFREGWDDA